MLDQAPGNNGDIVVLRREEGVDFGNQFIASVRFEIPSDLQGAEYTAFLNHHFRGFIGWYLSNYPSNGLAAKRFNFEEGPATLCDVYIGGNWFQPAELFVYEAVESPDWKGIWMHNPKGGKDSVNDLYFLAEQFELFLIINGVSHRRYGRRVNSSLECRQISQPVE